MNAVTPIGSRTERPEEVAVRYMRSSPPTDLVGLARDLGLEIAVADLGDIAGSIERRNINGGSKYVISLNAADSLNRQRFTLAHEIAHYIKHRHIMEGGLRDNRMYRSHLPESLEWEANRYAAGLLMPLSAMRKLYGEGLREPADFASRLQVSEEAASIRLGQLKGSLALEFGP